MKPVLQALLLADHIYMDQATGKKVVAGIFHKLSVFGPAKEKGNDAEENEGKIAAWKAQRIGSPYAYISLTEIRQETDLVVRYVNADTLEVHFQTHPFKVQAQSPLDTVEVVVPLPPLPVSPGTYGLELHCDEELLGFHRVVVEQLSTE